MFNRLKTIDETKLDREKIEIYTYKPIYITMSTIPSRMKNTFKIIENFLQNVSGNYKIILNIPYKYNRFPNFSIDCNHEIRDSRFILNRTEDYGPITKILPSLEIIPKGSIVIICDDMCYKLNAFKDIAELQDRDRTRAYSFYVYPFGVDGKTPVNVPQGADLISVQSENLSSFPEWYNSFKEKIGVKSYFDSPCFFVDDQVIGWYFQDQGIPMTQVERKHRNIYIKDCDLSNKSYNLNMQKGKNSRKNTMEGCYKQLNRIYPLN